MKINIVNIQQEITDQVELDQNIFGLLFRNDIIHRVIEWQRSKRRSGTHKTKGVSEISGTTRKPYKQKGTGSARQGSLRSAQFRGGATIFGPVVRSHGYDLPKKIRKLGLKIALSSKLQNNKLIIMQDINIDSLKTRDLLGHIEKINSKKILLIDGNEINDNFKKASSNIRRINVIPQIGANVYDIIKHDHLILTLEGLNKLTERLK